MSLVLRCTYRCWTCVAAAVHDEQQRARTSASSVQRPRNGGPDRACQEVFHLAAAERQAHVHPDRTPDDLGWKAEAKVGLRDDADQPRRPTGLGRDEPRLPDLLPAI